MTADGRTVGRLRRAAAALVVALIGAACGAAPASEHTVAAQAAVDGVIDLVADLEDGLVEVIGWVEGGPAVPFTIRVGDDVTAGTASQARPDLDAAGRSGVGFDIVVAASVDDDLCLVVGGREVDCVRRGCVDMFDSAFRGDLRDDHPDPRWSVSVVDLRTGCEYGVRSDRVMTSASVIKIQFLAGLTQRAADDGRSLNGTELALAEAMMHYSLNPESGSIIGRIGGNAALERLDGELGAIDTIHVSPFGATLTTAADRTRVAVAALHGDGSLDGAAVEMAREIVAGLHPAQAWGVSAGVPADHDVLLKNGFFPLSGFGWRVASSGVVTDPLGGAYAITVLTDFNETQLGGIEMVEAISRHVAAHLTEGPAGVRPYDDWECIDHGGGGSWTGLALALGLEATDADDVRRVAGGDGPMRGQLVCRP